MSNDKKKPTGLGSSLLVTKKTGTPATKKGLGGALGAGKAAKRSTAFTSAARIKSVSPETLDTLRSNGEANRKDRGFLGYIIDATGSRRSTWNLAKEIQKDMFMGVSKVGNLSARVVAFRNGNQGRAEILDMGWHSESQPIIDAMDKVSCKAGETQIFRAIQEMVDGDQQHLPTNIVMIGDMCEEDDIIINPAIHMLQKLNIKVFAFQEGSDRRGEQVYRNFAKHTGGAFSKFGPQMPLEDLCEAVGVYTVGDENDFQRLMGKSKAAKLLGRQVLQIENKKGPNSGPKKP